MKRLLGLATVLVLATGTGARADCYPPNPSNGSGHVDKTQVAPGECVTFSGTGFKPRSDVFVTDNGADRGSAKADSKGEFSHEVCFGYTAQPGQHELQGRGTDKGGDCGNGNGNGQQALGAGRLGMAAFAPADKQRTVTATVYVLGAAEVAKPGSGGQQGREEGTGSGSQGGGLPFTGDLTFVEGTAGLLLLLVGAGALVAARPRRRSGSPA